MVKTIKWAKAALCLAVALAVLLTGCGKETGVTPTAAEISGISSAAGFLASRVEESGGFIASAEQKANTADYAYLYDNAVAAIALSCAGADGQAQKIADAIVFAQEHDRTFHDGRLRNTYLSGDPRSDSGRSLLAGRVEVRLPGFWQDGKWQEDSYTVSSSTGNIAWAVLALCTVAENASGAEREGYLAAAQNAADFILTLKAEGGGFTAGYEGWDDAQTKASYLSTEHNIGLICAFSYLADLVEESHPDQAVQYREASEHARVFVFSMYDEEQHCFYTGTEADGATVSEGVIPLDANSLALLALGGELEDSYQVLSFIEKRIAVGEGFDFSAGDLDGVWNEGTAQMAVCYSMLGNAEKYAAVMAYLKTQVGEDGSIPAADRDGLSTGFVIVGSDALWEYNNIQSIGATGWFALAQMKKNPLDRGSDRVK